MGGVGGGGGRGWQPRGGGRGGLDLDGRSLQTLRYERQFPYRTFEYPKLENNTKHKMLKTKNKNKSGIELNDTRFKDTQVFRPFFALEKAPFVRKRELGGRIQNKRWACRRQDS